MIILIYLNPKKEILIQDKEKIYKKLLQMENLLKISQEVINEEKQGKNSLNKYPHYIYSLRGLSHPHSSNAWAGSSSGEHVFHYPSEIAG